MIEQIKALERLSDAELNVTAAREIMNWTIVEGSVMKRLSASDGNTYYQSNGMMWRWWDDIGPAGREWKPAETMLTAYHLRDKFKTEKEQDQFVKCLYLAINREEYKEPEAGLSCLWDFADATARQRTIAAIIAVKNLKASGEK